jgi:hypothetical protein
MQNTANNNPANVGIKNSWSLHAFAKLHGTPKVTNSRTFTNSNTGEEFTATSLAFIHPTEKDSEGRALACFVGFSRNLGELTAKEISERQYSLQVVETNAGKFILCEQGSGWDEVSLDL